jgi:hypothetical protein
MALVKPDVSEESVASIFREKRISELGALFAVTSNLSMLSFSTCILDEKELSA